MILCMKSEPAQNPLTQEILRQLDLQDWSFSELERRAGLSGGMVSRLTRGLMAPTHETIEKIADALQVDVVYLKEIAGLRVEAPSAQRDSRIEYIARRIAALPPDLQEEAIEALGTQLDVIYRVSGFKDRPKSDDELLEEEMAALDEQLPHIEERLKEIKAKERQRQQNQG